GKVHTLAAAKEFFLSAFLFVCHFDFSSLFKLWWFSGHATTSACFVYKDEMCTRKVTIRRRVWVVRRGMAQDWITEKIRIVE
ncbi:MAG: hypothetical protein KAI21_06875, partial [Deltaproteobacteria bacterium]|nr:hypothetical protein [Deltaproteobacteria bacterium]